MEHLANIITNYCVRKNIIVEDKSEIYCYGFKLIFADVVNFAIVLTLGIILKRFAESVIFLICLCGLRRFSGGFHAKTFWLCRTSMTAAYLCVAVLTDAVVRFEYKLPVTLLLNAASFAFICKYAPAEHPNKPLTDEKKRVNKIKAIITSCFLSAISILFVIADIKYGVTISMTLFAVVILMIVGMQRGKG